MSNQSILNLIISDILKLPGAIYLSALVSTMSDPLSKSLSTGEYQMGAFNYIDSSKYLEQKSELVSSIIRSSNRSILNKTILDILAKRSDVNELVNNTKLSYILYGYDVFPEHEKLYMIAKLILYGTGDAGEYIEDLVYCPDELGNIIANDLKLPVKQVIDQVENRISRGGLDMDDFDKLQSIEDENERTLFVLSIAGNYKQFTPEELLIIVNYVLPKPNASEPPIIV